ncbi:FliO/MopB family protein [Turneriella parva]|nr:flagellar biosynthetic protein FliO [Turneriella parva]
MFRLRQMKLSIVFSILILFAPNLKAQDADVKTPAAPAAVEKPATEAPRKAETLDDFDRQLQRELDATPGRPANGTEQPSLVWQFVRTLLTLSFLLAIFYGIFRLYKFKRELPQQSFSAITSIYDFPLGPNQRLQILEIAGRLMILGVSENSVQLISEVTDKYTVDRIKLDCAEDKRAPQVDFITELSRVIKTNLSQRFGKKDPGSFSLQESGDDNTELEAQRRSSMERLRKMRSEKFDWRDKP